MYARAIIHVYMCMCVCTCTRACLCICVSICLSFSRKVKKNRRKLFPLIPISRLFFHIEFLSRQKRRPLKKKNWFFLFHFFSHLLLFLFRLFLIFHLPLLLRCCHHVLLETTALFKNIRSYPIYPLGARLTSSTIATFTIFKCSNQIFFLNIIRQPYTTRWFLSFGYIIQYL